MSDTERFKIDTVTVKPDRDQISGPDGKVHLEPRVMDFMVYVAQRAGQVVTREELIETVWQGYPGADQSLSTAAFKLRQALAEAGGDREQLETIPKRGYRLVGPVHAVDDDAKRKNRLIISGAAVALVLGLSSVALYTFVIEPRREALNQAYHDQSIAVLPFVDLSPEGDQEYFADGMSEELTNLLARIGDLKVVARTSAFKFKDSKADVAEIGRALNVATILEGSVRKSGDRIRVTAQLNETDSGFHLWSQSYDGELADIFDIQDEIARAIVDELKVELLEPETRKLHSEATDSVRAYDLYLAGRQYFYRRGEEPDNVLRARELFEQVIEIEPGFAPAWSGLADTFLTGGPTVRTAAANQRALEAAKKAVALDPDLDEAQASLGLALSQSGHLDQSVVHLRKAIELNPGNAMAHQWLGGVLSSLGRTSESVDSYARAAQLDPLHAITVTWYADALVEAGRYDQARAELVRMLEFEPENDQVLDFLVRLSSESGRFVEAHDWWARWYDMYSDQPEESAQRCCFPAVMYAGTQVEVRLGRTAVARSRVTELREVVSDENWFFRGAEMIWLNATGHYEEMYEIARGWDFERLTSGMRALTIPFTGRAAVLAGDFQAAISLLEPVEDQWGWQWRSEMDAVLAYAYRKAGREESAAQLAAESLAYLNELETLGNRHPFVAYRRTMFLAILDRREDALDALDLAYERGWRHYYSEDTMRPVLDELMGDAPGYLVFNQKVLADIERMRKETTGGNP